MAFAPELRTHAQKVCTLYKKAMRLIESYYVARLVVRIRCDATSAQCPLGIKFGCDPVSEAPRLLKLAAVMGLNVVGVSFHVGSGAQETGVYARAIQFARGLFDLGDAAGHTMYLLDIGGGFPGNSGTSIVEVSQVINAALELHFPSRSVRVIAEPGRYFAAAAYTLAAMVHATRQLPAKDGESAEEAHTMYFINDGVYGSFNCVLYDHQQVHATPLEESSERAQQCSIWGPSCDGLDCVLPTYSLPPQRTGNWLVFKDMGAYTIPVASPFNGFPTPKVRAVVDKHLW
ncbi:jg27642 [Pararge aegeria aegeria]|uniref:Jg27642 protein n=1 Tax=Pararge aegeria aegeria TaxID=348720 RepID=A0A8S4S6J3_9NEOP|nr:jg27642 [Pararge aegeria aegeria]